MRWRENRTIGRIKFPKRSLAPFDPLRSEEKIPVQKIAVDFEDNGIEAVVQFQFSRMRFIGRQGARPGGRTVVVQNFYTITENPVWTEGGTVKSNASGNGRRDLKYGSCGLGLKLAAQFTGGIVSVKACFTISASLQ